MQNSPRLVAILITSAAAGVPVTGAVAGTVVKVPAASRYYPFVGDWQGQGHLSEQGQAPMSLVLRLSCRKASSGWAVRCAMVARHDKLTMTESDLMAVDPVTGVGHWYAVTNQGETHDHITEWTDARTMKARHTWMQDGNKMKEDISFKFSGKKSMTFRSVVTADGKKASEFSGQLKR